MNWKTEYLLVGIIFFGCSQPSSDKESSDYYNTKHLIEVDALLEILDDPRVKLLDVRRPKNFQEGHIMNANFLWRNEFEDTTYSYSGMRPTKSQMEAILSNKGLNSGDYIVLYDNNGACDAARVWWILKLYGYEKMAILNGGLKAWEVTGRSINKNDPEKVIGNFTFDGATKDNSLIEKEELLTYIQSGELVIIDTRSTKEYSGHQMKKGASRAGRIPKSEHIDWISSINYGGDMKFKTKSELKEIYQSAIENESKTIVYCHSGVRSAHTFFVLTELLGVQDVSNYDGSWTEWSYHENLPIEKQED